VAFYQFSSLIGMARRQTYIYCLRPCHLLRDYPQTSSNPVTFHQWIMHTVQPHCIILINWRLIRSAWVKHSIYYAFSVGVMNWFVREKDDYVFLYENYYLFKVHRNVNDIRKQIIVFIKKHIITPFTHKSIHNFDRKGIKYWMFYPCWSTSLVVNKQFWSDQSAVDQNDTMRLYGV